MDNNPNFEAYVLLTLPTATLRTPFGPITGPLALEYVSHDRAPPPGFLLLLRVAAYETVLDPSFAIRSSFSPSGDSSYVLRGTGDTDDLVLTIPPPHEKVADDLETLHSVLTEYGARPDVKDSKDGGSLLPGSSSSSPSTTKIFTDSSEPVHDPDLRGRFVLVNEESHDVVGALDSSVRVREDPVIYERGHERDPVVVELPEGVDELAETEVMVRAIPPEDRGWMVNGAMFASHVISGTTTLLTSAMGAASSLYVSRATPSPHANPSSSSSSPTSKDPSTPPIAPPSRTMLLLQSPTTRKNLTRIHTLTGHAVTLSSKAAGMVNDTIDRAVGAKKGKGKSPLLPPRAMPGNLTPTMEDGKPPLPRRSVSPAPPAYYPADDKRGALYPSDDKPALPPRRSPLPSPSRSPIPLPSSSTPLTPPTPGIKPTTKARVALSAALIFASLSTNTQRLVTAGGDALSAAVTHKYGADAGDSVRMATVSARNVVLVYVDVKGMGRKAVVKRAVKGYAKGVVRKDVRA